MGRLEKTYEELIQPEINKIKALQNKIKRKRGMITSIIPKFLLEEETLIDLKDKGVKFESGSVVVNGYKVDCIKFYNLTECQVFDKIEHNSLLEAATEGRSEAEAKAYASRNLSIIFNKVRAVANIKDRDLRVTATCSLLAAVNGLAAIDFRQASRFLPMIRGIAQ